ncbi:solute carrier family 13 member 1-like isoform X2 [Stigmatopora nigra]
MWGKLRSTMWNYRRVVFILLLPPLLLPLPIVIANKESCCAFVLLLMAIFWTTEVIPLPITAMFPGILFPALGIMTSAQVAMAFFKDFHFLLVGVSCLATSVQKWGLHRRLALRLVAAVGVNPAWLTLGFMSGCGFLSMWMNNTSAVTMVMPIVEAVLCQIQRVDDRSNEEPDQGHENHGLELSEVNVNTENETVGDEQNLPEETLSSSSSASSSVSEEADVTQVACMTVPVKELMVGKAMCIGVAYASNIGGIATLPGTSVNLIFYEYLHQIYPDCNSINFGKWLALCLPISVISLFLTWAWLCWLFIDTDFRLLGQCDGDHSQRGKVTKKIIQEEYRALGPMSGQEQFTLVVFCLMILLWFTRAPGFIPGWASLIPHHSDYITDATVALALGILFFLVPAYGPSRKYGKNTENLKIFKMGRMNIEHDVDGVFFPESMISWAEFQAFMPWKVSLLVGGGFALAEGTKESGLSRWVSELLSPLGSLPPLATVTVACIIVTMVTELASNATTITIFLPILSPLAEGIRVNPLSVLIPATLCTSFSFLLPASNPPNAVVFAYGYFSIADMVKAGLGANVIGLPMVLLAVSTWGVPLFSLDRLPDWVPCFNATTP